MPCGVRCTNEAESSCNVAAHVNMVACTYFISMTAIKAGM